MMVKMEETNVQVREQRPSNSYAIPNEIIQEEENWGGSSHIPRSLGYRPSRNSYFRIYLK